MAELPAVKPLPSRPQLPEVRLLPIRALDVDHTYQHAPYRKMVAELKARFQWDLMGFILVNVREDGKMFIIDGWTRWSVCQDLGITHIPAEVKHGMTVQEEAQAYMVKAINLQRQPVDLYKAGVQAGEPEYVAIHHILEERSIEVQQYADVPVPVAQQPYKVTCVEALRAMYRSDTSGRRLAETLDLVIDTWAYERSSLTKHHLLMVHAMLGKYATAIKRNRFVDRLKDYSPLELKDSGRKYQDSAIASKPTLRAATLKAVYEIYNQGLKEGRIGLED